MNILFEMRGRAMLAQWATYVQDAGSTSLYRPSNSLSVFNRQDAYLTVEKWLERQPYSEAGLQDHLRGWYRQNGAMYVESAREPDKFKILRLMIETQAAQACEDVTQGIC